MGKKKKRHAEKQRERSEPADISRAWKGILIIALLVFIGLSFAQKIFFINADLGRHIKNGEVFFERGSPITTNHYSYTEPDFPTINHHWGTGVLFYLIWKWFGFLGLSVMNSMLYVIAVLFFLKTALARSRFSYAFVCCIMSIPLITFRVEIRPEAFSYAFMGIFYYLLHRFKDQKVSFKTLIMVLVPLQVVWTNLHIFFIMGPFLIGVFWFHSLICPEQRKSLGVYTALGVISGLACLLNPFGLHGFLEPFMILREYGYMIAENQSVIFMQKRFPDNPVYYHFEAVFLITVVSFVLLCMRVNTVRHLPQLIIMIFLSVLSWRAIRGIPVFGLFVIPVVSENISAVVQQSSCQVRRLMQRTALAVSVIIMGTGFFSRQHYYTLFKKSPGVGLVPGVNVSADFFRYNSIQGPIFNNYDIGGYLIFHVFPEQKVFVDNRPEAYSISFFKEIYEPMQEHEERWAEIDAQYGFNCIYFYRHDMTPHAQPFLIRRLEDPAWAPVFVDLYSLILLKRNARNEALIRKYELPREIFRYAHESDNDPVVR